MALVPLLTSALCTIFSSLCMLCVLFSIENRDFIYRTILGRCSAVCKGFTGSVTNSTTGEGGFDYRSGTYRPDSVAKTVSFIFSNLYFIKQGENDKRQFQSLASIHTCTHTHTYKQMNA